MGVKAYRIDIAETEWGYVLAETAATAFAACRGAFMDFSLGVDCDWERIRKKRVPELDGECLTEQQLCDAELCVTEPIFPGRCYGPGEPILLSTEY